VLLSQPSQARVGHRFHEAAHKRVWSSSDCGFDTADCRCRSSLHLIGRPVSDLGKRTVNVERFPNPALDTPTMPPWISISRFTSVSPMSRSPLRCRPVFVGGRQ